MKVAREQKNISALRKYIGKWWKLKTSLNRPITEKEIPMTEKVTAPDELKNSYARIEIPMSWHQAVKICEELGGHLATVTTDKENRLLYQKFTSRQLCWLGGTDEKHNGTWRWVTGESFTYKKWYSGEPNNSGRIEHYLCTGNSRDLLNPGNRSQHQFNFRWSDQSTDGSPDGRHFIYPLCEWESNPARLPRKGGNALLGSRQPAKPDRGATVPEKDNLPIAIPVKGRPGMVYSPFVKGKQIRVRGLPAGSKVLDPHSKKFFRIP
ncbi:MAG: lectin-like protein, partial [Verrucomicrobiota bacterium]